MYNASRIIVTTHDKNLQRTQQQEQYKQYKINAKEIHEKE